MYATNRNSWQRVELAMSSEHHESHTGHTHSFDIDQIKREVVDIIQTHYRQVGQYLAPEAPLPLLLAPSGPLHQDIAHLIRIANGDIQRHYANEKVFSATSTAIQRIVDVLFLSPGGLQTAPIPVTFWTSTNIGKLIVQALDWMQRDDLISALVTRSLEADIHGMNKQAMRDCLELRGKTLPVVFTKGLMGAIIDIFGYSGGAPELLRLTVADILPTLQRWQNWFSLVAILNPLCAYYRSDLGHPEPVDYAFLERLRHAIDQLYPQGGAYLAQQIGWSWWINDFPLARRWYSSYGLHHLLGTTIVQTLQQTTFQAPSGKHVDEARFLWSEQQRVRTACRSFAQAIQQESGIVCTIKEWERVLLIHFSECPFCANALPDCNIFFGLVERMILWLYGEHRLDRLPTVHHSLCSEVTGGIVDVRPIHNDSHTIAVLFAPREHGFEKSH